MRLAAWVGLHPSTGVLEYAGSLNRYEDTMADELKDEHGVSWPDFCQGARCGHLEGRGRAGSYIIGEEEPLSYEAAAFNVPAETHRYLMAWARGYRYGYKLAAEGSSLPSEVESAPLPR